MQYSSLDYRRSLDGVRAIAILLVLMIHHRIGQFGWVGVMLFFVLSGYLITQILLVEREKAIPPLVKFRNFWLRRVLRIFPIYYLYLLILLLVWIFLKPDDKYGADLPYLMTYTYNFKLSSDLDYSGLPVEHLWSLSVEEQFYLLFPFLILLCKYRVIKLVTVLLILFSILFRIFYSQNLSNVYEYDVNEAAEKTHYLTFSHFDAFLLGGCIAIFNLDRLSVKKQYFLFFSSIAFLMISGFVAYEKLYGGITCLSCFVKNWGFEFQNVKFQTTYLSLNFFFFTLILILVSKQGNRLKKILEIPLSLKPLVLVGQVSYGMYVFHLPIAYLFSSLKNKWQLNINGYVFFVIYVLTLYLICRFIFEVYEKRFLTLKERFR